MRTGARTIAVAATFLLLAGCGGEESASPEGFAGAPLEAQDPGPVHVHGLGYDATARVLYLATHTGMFELPDGAAKAKRIGDKHQDTMGFSLVEPGLFFGSGHPDARDNSPPHLGLIKSTDRGRSWQSVSLLGEADFHVLRARGNYVYGYDTTRERLLASADAGKSWKRVSVPEAILDLAVEPGNPQHILASGGAALYRSVSGGRSWKAMGSGVAGFLAWPTPRRIYVATFDGALLTATAPTGPWKRKAPVGGPVAALLAVDEKTLYVAQHDGTLKKSSDGGKSWRVRATP
jgi:hypothetical protein